MKLILKSDVKYFLGAKVRGPKKSCMARGPDHGLVGPPLKPPLPPFHDSEIGICQCPPTNELPALTFFLSNDTFREPKNHCRLSKENLIIMT